MRQFTCRERFIMRTSPVNRRVRRGFTLVEMLVVITIIGILAGLAIPAVIMARTRAKIAVVVMDIKQLEMACQAYKEKFGEYPPDFAFVNDPSATINAPARAIVLRHLAKAFPRYTPGVNGGVGWRGLRTDLSSAGIDADSLTPRTALAFWLGGVPDPANNYLPSGFAANPTNPFQTPAQCPSRNNPFFDFDPTRLKPIWASGGGATRAWLYWPQGITVDVTPGIDNVAGAITYFRAENGTYTVDGTTPKTQADANGTLGYVCPAIDTRLTANVSYINPKSVQIFSSGLDTKYGDPRSTLFPFGGINFPVNGSSCTVLAFPTGENYQPNTYDDITNFSGGKLEDSIP